MYVLTLNSSDAESLHSRNYIFLHRVLRHCTILLKEQPIKIIEVQVSVTAICAKSYSFIEIIILTPYNNDRLCLFFIQLQTSLQNILGSFDTFTIRIS